MDSPDHLPTYRIIFETERLIVRTAVVEDVDMIYRLWTDGRVMGNVGFPTGLRIGREEIENQIKQQAEGDEYTQLLIVEKKEDRQAIGECKLGWPDSQGISETDIKLLPEFWGNHYGVEVKRGLVEYLFAHTACIAVDASPNVENIASIKMQEAVGGIRVSEGVYEFPEGMREFTKPVHYYLYRVYRNKPQGF